jgi:hypothetical protein
MRVAQQSRPAGVGPGRSTGRRSFRTPSARSPPQAGRARHRSRVVGQRHTCLVVRSYARSRWQAAGRLCLRPAKRGEKKRQSAVGSRQSGGKSTGCGGGVGPGRRIHPRHDAFHGPRTGRCTAPTFAGLLADPLTCGKNEWFSPVGVCFSAPGYRRRPGARWRPSTESPRRRGGLWRGRSDHKPCDPPFREEDRDAGPPAPGLRGRR